MSSDAVVALRAFNRFHTRFAGVLQPSYMESGMGLTGARLLYEIAQQDDVLASDLQQRLGLDAGYLSRLLQGFERKGWIVRGRGADDARQRPIRLTGEGRAAFTAIDDRTRGHTETALAGLDAEQQDRLVDALATVRTLLGDRPDMPWTIRTFRAGDVPLIASRQSLLYARENGWGLPMERLQTEVTTAFLRDFKPGREQCWVAERAGRMLGAIMLVDAGDGVAQLRMLHVEPEARGQGIGGALVVACIAFARAAGYARLRLWTHAVLLSARRLYAAAGFTLVSTEDHDHFGATERGEIWELPLDGETG
jgi:DNA-binding MarR family transcriptional regulator/GNAT superfamily N-acetyltransferase